MNKKVATLQETIIRLEKELGEELELLAKKFEYSVERNRVRFKKSAAEYHKKLRKSGFRFVFEAKLSTVLVAPVIFSMIVPLVFVDASVYVYQLVCFPAYGIKKVPRSDFIVFDRHNLEYLNYLERLNCLYCSYANGVFAWVRQIAARTEAYWCPIKHSRRVSDVHPLYDGFEDYGDAEGYRRRINGHQAPPPGV